MALPAGRSGGRSESASRRQGDAGNDAGLVLAVAEEALNRIGPLMSPASSIATTAPRCSTSIRPCFANRTATRRVLAMSSRQGPRSPSRRRGISEGLRSVCVMLCCVCKGGMGQGMRCEVRGLMFGKGRDGQGWADDSGVCSSALHPKHSNPPPPPASNDPGPHSHTPHSHAPARLGSAPRGRHLSDSVEIAIAIAIGVVRAQNGRQTDRMMQDGAFV